MASHTLRQLLCYQFAIDVFSFEVTPAPLTSWEGIGSLNFAIVMEEFAIALPTLAMAGH